MSPLGSHLRPEDRLSGRRERLYDTIREEPGLSRTRLAEKAGSSKSSVRYHLRLLERWDLVRGVHVDRHCRYFVRDGRRANYEARAYARNPVPARLLEIVTRQPGLRQHEIVTRYGDGMSRLGIAYHLGNSVRLGLLYDRRDGVRTYWPAAPGGENGEVTA